MRRRYTKREQTEAVGIAEIEGVTAAGEMTGIPKTTIWEWMQREEFEQLRTNARDKVGEWLWIGLQVGTKELVAGLIGDAPLNHKADAFRALADRYALLMGEATVRSESRDITGTLSDVDLIEAVRTAERHLAASHDRAATEAESPTEG